MRQVPRLSLLRYGLLLLATLASLSVRATDIKPTPLPAWQVLEYEQQAFFVTATSRVEIVADSADRECWRLTANSSVASNSENVVLELAAADGRTLLRSRLSKGKGKEQRYKTYEFLPEQILRVRHDPPADASTPPDTWPVSSRKEIAYPPLATGLVVTDAYALLALAGRFLTSADTAAEVVVNTEFNFYLVRMTHTDSPPIQVDYQLAGANAVTGEQQTRGVVLQVSALGEQREKPDFSLLGLNNDITLLFGQDSGLPLQLRGTAPRIGSTRINLKTVTLREPAA